MDRPSRGRGISTAEQAPVERGRSDVVVWMLGEGIGGRGNLTGNETGEKVSIMVKGGRKIDFSDIDVSSFAAEAAGLLGALRMLLDKGHVVDHGRLPDRRHHQDTYGGRELIPAPVGANTKTEAVAAGGV